MLSPRFPKPTPTGRRTFYLSPRGPKWEGKIQGSPVNVSGERNGLGRSRLDGPQRGRELIDTRLPRVSD